MTRPEAWKALALISIAALAVLWACGPSAPGAEEVDEATGAGESGQVDLQPIPRDEGEKLRVVATTNIVGDVVRNVAGDRIDLTVLMGTGIDPHTYVPTPADTAAIHDAHLVLANGAGLEVDLDEIFENAGGEAVHIQLSQGIDLLRPLPGGEEHQGEEAGHGEDEEEHGDVDPHVWFSVPNVVHWVETIEQALAALDPANADGYAENAQGYIQELEALDGWIQAQVAQIPEGNRKFVTNHPAFGYLASRYGLEQVGAVYPVSPSAEPSAQDIAALEDAIREFGVPAVFTESTVNPRLARQVAEDTGVTLVPLYSGSLGEAGSGAETYLDLMRYNVGAIVEALR